MYIGDFEYQHIGLGNLKVSMGRTLWLKKTWQAGQTLLSLNKKLIASENGGLSIACGLNY
jgi:hypothetical protein